MKSGLGEDAKDIEKVIDDTLKWLEEDRSTDEYKSKQEELEKILNPLIQKAYQNNMPNQDASKPTGVPQQPEEPKEDVHIEEVD